MQTHLDVVWYEGPQVQLQTGGKARACRQPSSTDHVPQQQRLDVWVLAQGRISHLQDAVQVKET